MSSFYAAEMLSPSSGSWLPPGLRPMQCQTRKVMRTARIRDLSEIRVMRLRKQWIEPAGATKRKLRTPGAWPAIHLHFPREGSGQKIEPLGTRRWLTPVRRRGPQCLGPEVNGYCDRKLDTPEKRWSARHPPVDWLEAPRGGTVAIFWFRPRHPSQESLLQARAGDKKKMNCNSRNRTIDRLFMAG
jgi:hypothetical protein